MKNGNATKIDIALLKQKVDTIQNNDLVHLAGDIKRVDEKVDRVEHKVDDAHDKIDELKVRMAYYSGGVAVVVIIVSWLFKR